MNEDPDQKRLSAEGVRELTAELIRIRQNEPALPEIITVPGMARSCLSDLGKLCLLKSIGFIIDSRYTTFLFYDIVRLICKDLEPNVKHTSSRKFKIPQT